MRSGDEFSRRVSHRAWVDNFQICGKDMNVRVDLRRPWSQNVLFLVTGKTGSEFSLKEKPRFHSCHPRVRPHGKHSGNDESNRARSKNSFRGSPLASRIAHQRPGFHSAPSRGLARASSPSPRRLPTLRGPEGDCKATPGESTCLRAEPGGSPSSVRNGRRLRNDFRSVLISSDHRSWQ
jgi:hypothetical protein